MADRANAVKQWLAAAEADPSMIKAPWLLLLESDYVWIKPLPVSLYVFAGTCMYVCACACTVLSIANARQHHVNCSS